MTYVSLDEQIKLFSHREIKAKEVFFIREITKNEAYEFVKKYHYLGDAKFFSQQAFGLFAINGEQLMGVATFCPPQGVSSLKGWFGLDNKSNCVYELSRLCMNPVLNRTNATSYLLSGSIKQLKKQGRIRAIITLADASRHIGSIYQVCNFKYYGLTDSKSDFCMVGKKPNARVGTTKDKHGVWVPRSRKHRYAYVIDPNLKVLYAEQPKPTIKSTLSVECCGGSGMVYDKRFGEWYTCPRCCKDFHLIDSEEVC